MAATGVCPFEPTRRLLLHVLLTVALIVVQSTQGILLDLFLISAAPKSVFPYFWIISDLIIVFCFGLTMCKSYSYWKRCNLRNKRVKSLSKMAESLRNPTMFAKYRGHFGYHPLSYMAWFVYSVLTVVKVAVIFKLNIINKLDHNSYLTTEVMKLALASTAFIFFLFIEGHYSAERNSKQALYIASLIKGTTIEILDSISFLSLLMVAETHMLYSFQFEDIIIAFACINLLLPNICLYKLSQNDYGRKATGAAISFAYKMAHLLLVNIPYMIIRIYLWSTLRMPISVFLIKNILYIGLAILDCKSDFIILYKALNKIYTAKESEKQSSIKLESSDTKIDIDNDEHNNSSSEKSAIRSDSTEDQQ